MGVVSSPSGPAGGAYGGGGGGNGWTTSGSGLQLHTIDRKSSVSVVFNQCQKHPSLQWNDLIEARQN